MTVYIDSETSMQICNKYLASQPFSPDGQTIASVEHYQIHLLNRNTGQPLKTLKSELAGNCTFSPDGKTLAIAEGGGGYGKISLLNVNTGRELLLASERRYFYPVFSPDGKTITAGSEFRYRNNYYGLVILWDVNTGKERARLTSFQVNGIRAVAFSSDGKTIASGSSDGIVGLWNVETEELQKTFHFPNDSDSDIYINRVLFSPDGETLAAISGRSIQCWKIEN